MRPLITLTDRVEQAATLLLFAGLVLCVGRALLRVIGRSSPARRRHGRFVLGWMLAGWLAGGAYGVYGVYIIDNQMDCSHDAYASWAGFGMLIGWVIGMVHGGVVVLFGGGSTERSGSAGRGH